MSIHNSEATTGIEQEPNIPRSRTLESQIELLRQQTMILSMQLDQQKSRSSMLEQKLFIHAKSGLPNHHRLDEDLQKAIDKAAKESLQAQFLPASGQPMEPDMIRDGTRVAVIIIRLDEKYDMVLKTLKASVSEWILYQIGIRLSECVQPGENLYHTKDDEYVLILGNFTNAQHLKTRLSAMYDSVTKPHIFSGHHLYLGCNMGISIFPRHGADKSAILHSADIALGQSIADRKPWLIYEDAMQTVAVEKMEIQNGIIRAIESQSENPEEEQFALYYQPQVQLVAQSKGNYRIDRVDAEVLIRWKHPEKGQIAPDQFIPLAEKTGLILPIGNWVMFKAIEQLERWEGTPLERVTLSINISPRQFADQQLMDNLVAMMYKRPSLKHRLKLEITETSLMQNPEQSIQRMRYLNKMGIRFALDDFGKGYSSLNYLNELPLHTLKLDRAFISNVHQNPADQAIVRAVVFLSKRLKLKLICEGIENVAQLNALERQGCRSFQGYYFSKALSVDDFARFIQKVEQRPMVPARA